MNKEYIERSAVVNLREEFWKDCCDYMAVRVTNIMNIPAADVVPVVHGEWIKGEENSHKRIIECSHCKTGFVLDSSETNPFYCPNCGTRMDGGKSND